MNGAADHVDFLGAFDLLFAGDFTISFYMQPETITGIIDLISKKENCTSDSSLSIRYESGSRTIRAELSQSILARGENIAVLPTDVCWQHIAWVRNGVTLFLYVNGVLANSVNTPGVLNVSNNGVFSISNSPCLANGEQRLRGRIDELRLYNRALATGEIEDLYFPIDQIATRDTFIFVGESVQISVPNSCATAFSWSPVNGVVSPIVAEPVITPVQTETFQLTMEYPACIATDTVRITLLDSTQVDCDDVFIPNAFTPNGDQLNDAFGISNKFFLGEFIGLEIYDRWGTQLFKGFTPNEKWDGTYLGEDAIPDTYLYKMYYKCNGVDQVRAGSFVSLK
jgi:gliding motility-associated-like protein